MDNRDTREQSYRQIVTVFFGGLFLSIYFSMPANSQPHHQQHEEQLQQASQQPQSQRPPSRKPESLRQMDSDDLTEDLLVMRLGDKRSFFSGMQVIVDQGVATLRGKVPSEAIESRALRIAWRTPGVRSVRDQLEVDQDMKRQESRNSIRRISLKRSRKTSAATSRVQRLTKTGGPMGGV